MWILIKFLINVHLLVNELCEYQNARCNDKNYQCMCLCFVLITTWNIGSYVKFISKIGNKKRSQCTETFVSSRWGPFSYLIAYATYEVLCAVPLVSDLPGVVIYDWHSDSCLLRCSRDVDRDWLSLGSHVDNQFNIAYLEFFSSAR